MDWIFGRDTWFGLNNKVTINTYLNELVSSCVFHFPFKGSNTSCWSLQHTKSHGAVGVPPPVEQGYMEYEREETVVSPWTLPSEIHRILHDRPLLQVSAAQSSSVFLLFCKIWKWWLLWPFWNCLSHFSFLHCLYVFTYVCIYVCFVWDRTSCSFYWFVFVLFYFSFSLNPMINFQHLLVPSSISQSKYLGPSVAFLAGSLDLLYVCYLWSIIISESFHFPPMLDTPPHTFCFFLVVCVFVCIWVCFAQVTTLFPWERSIAGCTGRLASPLGHPFSAGVKGACSPCSFPPWALGSKYRSSSLRQAWRHLSGPGVYTLQALWEVQTWFQLDIKLKLSLNSWSCTSRVLEL